MTIWQALSGVVGVHSPTRLPFLNAMANYEVQIMNKSSKHWYPRYSGDYRAKTAGLSLIQHGAYTLLLDEYYNTGKPLDANASVLHRICSALALEEQEAINFVLSRFFVLTDKGYINKRAEEELAKRMDISEKRKYAANLRHAKDLQTPCKTDANASAIAYTSTSTSTSTSKTTTKPRKNKNIYTQEFENLWKIYGSVGSKEDASIAFNKITGVDYEVIIGGIKRYQDYARANADWYSPRHASTWLNKRGWESEWQYQERKPTDAKREYEEAAVRGMLRAENPNF